MPVMIVLNELSCSNPAPRDRADEAMIALVDLLRTLKQWRSDVTLITQVALKSIELAEGYYVQEWIGAAAANRDRWRMIMAIRNRAPFRSAIPEDFRDEVEYRHDGGIAEGIGTAHLIDGLAISLRLSPAWDEPWLTVERSILEEDDSGAIALRSESVEVRHAAATEHASQHEKWVHEAGLDGLTSGSDIWENRDSIFPHLTFLPRVEAELRNLRVDWVRPVTGQLLKVEEAVAEWHDGQAAMPAWKTKVTGEFEARQRAFCEFVDLDGVVRVFELHARMTPGPGRLHFRLVSEDRTARVAYIGRKLG